MEKLDGKSMDIVAENIEKLKEIFPDVFTEKKVDFDALSDDMQFIKAVLMSDVEDIVYG
jgi:adenine-specific DNA-methyltransferase